MQKKILVYCILISSVLLLITSCKNNEEGKAKELTEQEIVELPQGFVDFYTKFHEDSVYQVEHIAFPLQTEDSAQMYMKEEWVMHRPFNDFGGTYFRDFQAVGNMVIETMGDNSGLLMITRRFAKTSDGWRLIYYDQMKMADDDPE